MREEIDETCHQMEETQRAHEQLQRENEELQCTLWEKELNATTKILQVPKVLVDLQPSSQAIMEEQVPPHYMVPKMAPFSGMGDPEVHLQTFKAQILILGGIWCGSMQNVRGTFTGITL